MNRYAALAAAAVMAISSVASAQAAAAAAAAAEDPRPAATPPPATPAAGDAPIRLKLDQKIEDAQLKLPAAQEQAVRAERDAAEAAHRAAVEAARPGGAAVAPPPVNRIRLVAPDGANAENYIFTTAVAAQRMEKGAYLGVSASPAPASLREQLKLSKNTGLVVEHVVPDSPAAAAGLQQHDVMVRLNDQLLVNAQQFVVLVRTYKPNDEIRLSIIRQGQPAELKVKLVERDLPILDEQGNALNTTWSHPATAPIALDVVRADGAGGGGVGGGGGGFVTIHPAPVADGAPAPQFRATRRVMAAQDKIVMRDNDYLVEVERKDNERRAKITETKTGKVVFDGPADSPDAKKIMPAKLAERMELAQAQAAAADKGVMFLSRGAARRSQEINWSDGERDFHIFAKESDGKRETRLVVKDIAGRVLFEGPIDTAEQRMQMPGDVAEKLTQALLANVPVKP